MALKGVARRLLIVLGIVADLEGGRPPDAGEFKDPRITPGFPWRWLLSCPRGCCALEGHGRRAQRRSHLLGGDGRLGGRWLRRPGNFLDCPCHRGWECGHGRLNSLKQWRVCCRSYILEWGRNRSRLRAVCRLPEDPFAASGAAEGVDPPTSPSWRGAGSSNMMASDARAAPNEVPASAKGVATDAAASFCHGLEHLPIVAWDLGGVRVNDCDTRDGQVPGHRHVLCTPDRRRDPGR
jgi:hypothetical protein